MKVIIFTVGLLQIFFIKTVISLYTCKPIITSCTSREIPDYYWRDFHGDVPGDAVPGGTTIAGSTTYIGQAYIKGRELLPVTIFQGCTNARGSASNVELLPDQNIKILCSNAISKFSWIPTTADTTPLITNCKFPIGGNEVNQMLNIGRVHYNGEIIIGKVYNHPFANKGLWIPNELAQEAKFLNYEILAFNCINKSNEIGFNLTLH